MKVEDIAYVIEGLGGDPNGKRSGDHVMFNCPNAPYHHQSGDDNTRKFGVMVQEGPAPCNCFYPGCFSGTLLGLVTEVGGKRVGDGLMTLEEVSDLKAFILMAEEEDVGEWETQKVKRPIPPEVLSAVGQGSPYWRGRGINADTEKQYQLGETGGRALIPFVNAAGEVVAVQGRLLPGLKGDDFPFDRETHDEKYRSWPVGFDRADFLFGESLLKKPVDLLVVVESPNDAVTLQQWLQGEWDAGRFEVFPHDNLTDGFAVVATMGGKFSRYHVQAVVDGLSASGEVVLAMDTDHAGRLSQRQLGDALWRRIPNVSEVEWKGKDPTDDEGGKLDPALVRKNAMKALHTREDFLSNLLARSLDK